MSAKNSSLYETRVYIRNNGVMNPEAQPEFIAGLAAIFLPILVEKLLGTAASALKKAGSEETLTNSARLPTYLYRLVKGSNSSALTLNPDFQYVIVVRGIFDKRGDDAPEEPSNSVARLRNAGIPVRDLALVYEAKIDIAADNTALRYESKYLEVNDFIGDEGKTKSGDRRGLVLGLTISGVGNKEGEPVLSLAMINFGEVNGGTIFEPDDLGVRQSSWLGGLAISEASLKSIENMKPEKSIDVMPITIEATIAETRDGNAALKFIGEVLDAGKTDAAKQLSTDILDGEKRAEQATSALEKLLSEEETAFASLLNAELEFAKLPALSSPPTAAEEKTVAVKRFAIESAGRAWCAKFGALEQLGRAPNRPGHACPVPLP